MTVKPYLIYSGQVRKKANLWLENLYEQGIRERPIQCQICGQKNGKIEHHSESYAEPFGDHIGKYRLCENCHTAHHLRFRCLNGYQQYREMVMHGRRIRPDIGYAKLYAFLNGDSKLELNDIEKGVAPKRDFFQIMLDEADGVVNQLKRVDPLKVRLVKKQK